MLENELEDEQDRTQVGPTPLNMFFCVRCVAYPDSELDALGRVQTMGPDSSSVGMRS